MSDPYSMGELAAQDSYELPPIVVTPEPTVPPASVLRLPDQEDTRMRDALVRMGTTVEQPDRVIAPESYKPAPVWANNVVQGAVGVGKGLVDYTKRPGQLMAPNPHDPASEEWQFYEDMKARNATEFATDTALNAMGTGGIVGVPLKMGEAALGAGVVRRAADVGAGGGSSRARDPRFWHPISGVKLAKPLEEYSSTHAPRATLSERLIEPADLQGKALLPTIADTTRPDTWLQAISDYKFKEPIPMQGGARFPAVRENNPFVWMSDQGPMTALRNSATDIGKQTGREVVVMPTALSPAGADYSHHIWRPLIDMVKDTKGISREGRESLNTLIRAEDPKFPGLGAKRETLVKYFEDAPRGPRTAFVQGMDTRVMQDAGFPDVAAVRHAAIDPTLLHAPLGSSGFSSFKLAPADVVKSNIHGTYKFGGSGEHVGSLGTIAPPEIMFPKVMDSLRTMAQESGKPLIKYTGRPDYYFQGRVPAHLDRAQIADQQWVDAVSDYIRRYKKVGGAAALASGMTMAEIAAAQERGELPPFPLMGAIAAPDQYEARPQQ